MVLAPTPSNKWECYALQLPTVYYQMLCSIPGNWRSLSRLTFMTHVSKPSNCIVCSSYSSSSWDWYGLSGSHTFIQVPHQARTGSPHLTVGCIVTHTFCRIWRCVRYLDRGVVLDFYRSLSDYLHNKVPECVVWTAVFLWNDATSIEADSGPVTAYLSVICRVQCRSLCLRCNPTLV